MNSATRTGWIFALLSLSGCAATSGPPRDVVVRWAPSPEAEVNAPGGGYTVFYSQTPRFAVELADYVDVDYVSGAATMTTATLPKLASGTWYIKVVARSTMPNGLGLTSQSPAAEATVEIP